MLSGLGGGPVKRVRIERGRRDVMGRRRENKKSSNMDLEIDDVVIAVWL